MPINNAYITRTAVCLPNEPVENDDIESILGEVNGKPSRAKRIILKSNGIKQRYYVLDAKTREPVYNNAQLTATAIRNLFTDLTDMDKIDCLVCGTTTPDQIAPNHAVMVHGELQTPPCEVIATSGICLSGITALKYAYLAIKSGEHHAAVSTGSETVSLNLRATNYTEEVQHKVEKLQKQPEIAFEKDFLRWMLSDGAGAFLVEPEPTRYTDQPPLKIEWLDIISYANELETCMYMGAEKQDDGQLKGWSQFDSKNLINHSVLTLKQDVKLLNENIVPVTFTRSLQKIISKRGVTADQIDYFLPHISSMFFYDKVKDAMSEMGFEIAEDKWFTNLSTKGNTGSASIYIMLDELLKSEKVKPGDTILCFIPESGRFSSSFMLLTAV